MVRSSCDFPQVCHLSCSDCGVCVGDVEENFPYPSFLMWSSRTSDMLMPKMLRMLLCQKALSLSMWDCRRAHVSQPHRSRLAGMVRKISCFARRSAYGFLQKFFRAPMARLAFDILLLMSTSLVRSNETNVPRYLKWAVKLMKDLLSDKWMQLVFGESQYSFSHCCWVMVEKVS